jgi:hypothetical protein
MKRSEFVSMLATDGVAAVKLVFDRKVSDWLRTKPEEPDSEIWDFGFALIVARRTDNNTPAILRLAEDVGIVKSEADEREHDALVNTIQRITGPNVEAFENAGCDLCGMNDRTEGSIYCLECTKQVAEEARAEEERLAKWRKLRWTYYGVNVNPADANNAGLRWAALCFGRLLRADTKAGMRKLIIENTPHMRHRRTDG